MTKRKRLPYMKRCPFCSVVSNAKRWIVYDGQGYFGFCYNCKGQGPTRPTDRAAVIAWNQRQEAKP